MPVEIKKLKTPECEILRPLDQFINLMRNVIPSSFDLLCSEIPEDEIKIISRELVTNRKNFLEIFS